MKIIEQNPKIFEEYFDKNCVSSEDFSGHYNKEFVEIRKNKKLFKLMSKMYPLMKEKNYKEYRKKWFFNNGFGIAVIRGHGTFGSEEGLFECAVMDRKGLRYDTKITDDVIENNKSEDILKVGKKIMKLK